MHQRHAERATWAGSTRSTAVRDENGNSCSTTDSQHQRWRRHFSNVLNITSQFSKDELAKVQQRPIRSQMTDLPTMEELIKAVDKLKNGKAGGSSGVLPEMLKAACCDCEFLDLLLSFVHQAWKERKVPKEWTDTVLVPIPKKGDMANCDNWRGIALLDVVGKVVARIVQGRLQDLAEEVLPEYQCGFRRGRGCSDMIFTVRQMVEKSWEHKAKAFLVFIDLRKAYDSVPREAMWVALHKLGVPDQLVQIIQSFHLDMKAQIRLGDTLLEEIDVDNGLRQGCCMAPALFNLYSCVVVERWLARVEGTDGVGVYLRHKHDGKLYRRYTRNANETKVTECQFADDAALLATTRARADRSLQGVHAGGRRLWTLCQYSYSQNESGGAGTGREVTETDRAPLYIDDTNTVESVFEFPYLGSMIGASGRMDPDIDRRVPQASKAFGALHRSVFSVKDLLVQTKRKIYQACVLSGQRYGSECWTLFSHQTGKLESFHHRYLRTILGISNSQQWEQRITSLEIRQRWGDTASVTQKLAAGRSQWL